MVGHDENEIDPLKSGQSPTDDIARGKPRVKTFSCTKCGASVSIRYPGATLSVACDTCKAVIDVTNPAYRIISTLNSKHLIRKPLIPLGSRGKLQDREWEVIGFVVRTDVFSNYSWDEYLLFNPFYGYRWLTCNNKHWSFVTTIKDKPQGSNVVVSYHNPDNLHIYLGKESYRLFYRGQVRISYVTGEFYWKAKVGHSVDMLDYICPPKMLSCEQDGTQRIWSLSQYIEAKEIQEAFKDALPLPTPLGMSPLMPPRAVKTWKSLQPAWLFFLVVLVGIQAYHIATSANLTVFNQNYQFYCNSKTPSGVTTEVFEIPQKHSNVRIDIRSDVRNSWFYLYGELVNDDTGETRPFETTVEYYQGVSGGESWSEGSTNKSILLNSVPAGKYYINFDTENGDYPVARQVGGKQFGISVLNGVETYQNWVFASLLVSILPLFFGILSYIEESSRWSESDFSPFGGEED